jgi:hypothetical protein
MSVFATAESLGEIFNRAHLSQWNGKDVTISPMEQIKWWREKYNVNIAGGHFENLDENDKSEHPWNTKDAVLEFEDEQQYVLFMLEWS